MPKSSEARIMTRGRRVLWQLLSRLVTGLSGHKKLAVLTFHGVLPAPDLLRPGEICSDEFTILMRYLKERFDVLPLATALEAVRNGTSKAGSIAITFDDGYRNNVEVALPILRELGLKATFFIATGFLDGGRMWNDTVIESVRRIPGEAILMKGLGDSPFSIASASERLSLIDQLLSHYKHRKHVERRALADELAELAEGSLPGDLMMATDDVRTLADAGMTIGGHTKDHPILRLESSAEVLRQLVKSRELLKDVSGQELSLFAYPNGRPDDDYGSRDVDLVREAGFEAAFTTSWGSIDARSNLFQLPRISLWDRTPTKAGLRVLQSLRSRGEIAKSM